MAIIFASNDTADWSGVTQDTTAVHYDATRVPYAMEFADNAGPALIGPHPEPSGNFVGYHFRTYWSQAMGPSEDGHLLTISDINGKFLARVEMLNGLLAMAVSGNGTTFTTGAYGATLTSSIQEIDIQVTVTAGSVTAELYIGQSLQASGTMSVTNTGSLGVARNFNFDVTDAIGGSGLAWFSEFVVSESDTRNLRLCALGQTGAGNHTDWDGDVADLADGDSATGMTSSTANQRQSVVAGAYSGGSGISSVLVVARLSRGASGIANARAFLRKGAVDYDGPSVALSETPGYVVTEWTTDPSDATVWTAADLTGLEPGIMSLA